VPAIRDVLSESILAGGSTIRDYAQPNGELGYFAANWRVYGREGSLARLRGTDCAHHAGRTLQLLVPGVKLSPTYGAPCLTIAAPSLRALPSRWRCRLAALIFSQHFGRFGQFEDRHGQYAASPQASPSQRARAEINGARIAHPHLREEGRSRHRRW
jgi:hypothetical protein